MSMDGYERYSGKDRWKNEYVRAQLAGRVIDPKVFPDILKAVEKPDKALFKETCEKVMDDLPEQFRSEFIDDMWAATMKSRKQAEQFKVCW